MKVKATKFATTSTGSTAMVGGPTSMAIRRSSSMTNKDGPSTILDGATATNTATSAGSSGLEHPECGCVEQADANSAELVRLTTWDDQPFVAVPTDRWQSIRRVVNEQTARSGSTKQPGTAWFLLGLDSYNGESLLLFYVGPSSEVDIVCAHGSSVIDSEKLADQIRQLAPWPPYHPTPMHKGWIMRLIERFSS